MTQASLLTPRIVGGRLVFETDDRRKLSTTGNSTSVSLDKSILELVGILEDQDDQVDGVSAEQTYRIDPERGEVVVELRLPLPDQDALPKLPTGQPITPEAAD
jgi:hypothetical protein